MTFQEESQAAAPLNDTDKQHGIEVCERLDNIRAGKTLENSKTPLLSGSGEEVVSGILVADVKQTSLNKPVQLSEQRVFLSMSKKKPNQKMNPKQQPQLTLN